MVLMLNVFAVHNNVSKHCAFDINICVKRDDETLAKEK